MLNKLREARALNEHGVGAAVGQAVKTASAAFFCAGLQVGSSDLATEADLLAAMAGFDSKRWMFTVERKRPVHIGEVESGVALGGTPDEAWVIARERRRQRSPEFLRLWLHKEGVHLMGTSAKWNVALFVA